MIESNTIEPTIFHAIVELNKLIEDANTLSNDLAVLSNIPIEFDNFQEKMGKHEYEKFQCMLWSMSLRLDSKLNTMENISCELIDKNIDIIKPQSKAAINISDV